MASKKSTGSRATSDRGFTLSQTQYDLMLNYLKNGITPTSRDFKAAELDTLTAYKHTGTFSRFKSIMRRLRYRASDNALLFYGNSKIVLPNTKFAEVIKGAHRSKGDKHMNFTKTLEKLSERYAIGCRQFGMSEEVVREVVRSCQEGSCAKHQKQSQGRKTPAKLPEIGPKTPAAVSNQGQPPQPVYIHSQQGQNYVAIPCMFNMPAAASQGSGPLKPCLVYTGSCNTQTPGTNPYASIPPQKSRMGTTAKIMLMPTPTSSVPNLVQLLTVRPTTPMKSATPGIAAYASTGIPQSSHTGVQYATANVQGSGSKSLTNISRIFGSINLEASTVVMDENNNEEKPGEPGREMETDAEEQGSGGDRQGTDDLLPAVYRDLLGTQTQSSKEEVAKTKEPYQRILGGIRDMRSDMMRATAGAYLATDSIRRKISAVEHMISNLKQFTQQFDTDSGEEE